MEVQSLILLCSSEMTRADEELRPRSRQPLELSWSAGASVAERSLKPKASFLSGRVDSLWSKDMQLQALPGQKQPVLSIKKSSFPGSNEKNKERAGKFPEGQGIAESNSTVTTSVFIRGRCSCLGSEALPAPLPPVRFAGP